MTSLLLPVSTLVTVTLALGTTDPEGSVTTPMTRPADSWAAIGRLNKTRAASSVQAHCQRMERTKFCMFSLPKATFPPPAESGGHKPLLTNPVDRILKRKPVPTPTWSSISLYRVLSNSGTGVNELLSVHVTGVAFT